MEDTVLLKLILGKQDKILEEVTDIKVHLATLNGTVANNTGKIDNIEEKIEKDSEGGFYKDFKRDPFKLGMSISVILLAIYLTLSQWGVL